MKHALIGSMDAWARASHSCQPLTLSVPIHTFAKTILPVLDLRVQGSVSSIAGSVHISCHFQLRSGDPERGMWLPVMLSS